MFAPRLGEQAQMRVFTCTLEGVERERERESCLSAFSPISCVSQRIEKEGDGCTHKRQHPCHDVVQSLPRLQSLDFHLHMHTHK